ncbi:hypothetical protein LTR62_008632 [Meristemomyces frigidus]|uniref:Uncharacterized protein n=1 Tax=Meristemomyces frigidus TaxID=1508187 RepID=A0AAN7TAH9_9PEZI|nr:hypothetical protein LTR62_008632 [Meristemomyces frigidus]
MRGYSLSARSKTKDSLPLSSPISPLSPAHPVQTSYDELRRPEGRRMLREQLQGAFPEVNRRASEDSVRASYRMPLKEKFTRRPTHVDIAANPSAKSSSSTVNSIAPTVGAGAEVDIARAIQLLQELKKTASPEDLVALHRALLPTKEVEVITSPQQGWFEERTPTSTSPAYHRRSALPPGLATRGGFAADILRKPEEASLRVNNDNERPTSWLRHSISTGGNSLAPAPPMHLHVATASLSSLAALDLADDATNPLGARAVTPGDHPWSPSGGYRPGTLHITNGAASPEPSLKAPRIAAHDMIDEPQPHQGYFPAVQGRGNPVLVPESEYSETLSHRMSEDNVSIRDRILSSDRAQHQRKQRASRLSGMSTASRESLESSKPAPLRITPNMQRSSFDSGNVSPVSDVLPTPRFKQRWSHRQSHIPAEPSASEPEPTASTTASMYDQNALREFAMRLSTVYDSDGDDEANVLAGTPEAALSRLTGDSNDHSTITTSVVERVSEDMSEETMPSPKQAQGPRPMPSQKDSGYGSGDSWKLTPTSVAYEERHQDESNPYAAASSSSRTITTKYESFLSDATLEEVSASPVAVSRPGKVQQLQQAIEAAESESLYSFKEFLTSPKLQLDLTNPFQELKDVAKPKRLPLLRLHTFKHDKRSSLPVLPSPTKLDSSDSLPTVFSLQSSPAEAAQAANLKQQKKLQKAIPAHIKKQRKEEYQKLKARQASAPELPAIPDSVFAGLASRFAHLPSDSDLHLATEDHQHERRPSAPLRQETAPPALAESAQSSDLERSRGRSKSLHHSTVERKASPEAKGGWGFMKSRSKSAGRDQNKALIPKFDMLRRDGSVHELAAPGPGDETPPAFTDFNSVAQTLGSGSYDIATNQTKRTVGTARGATLHHVQSPHLFSTGLHKIKATKGMNSTAASELARMKSRDFAKGDTVPAHDRPRMATPKGSKSNSSPNTPTRRVEDRFPDWTSKAASQQVPFERAAIRLKHTSYPDSIPPMPELPADVVAKASKSEGLMAKKLKDSARSSPDTSARNSGEPKDKMELQRVAEAELIGDNNVDTMSAVDEPAITTSPAKCAARLQADVDVEVRELAGSSSENSSFVEQAAQETAGQPVEEVSSPKRESQHAGWPGWEEQAKAWRKHRESVQRTLGKANDEISVITADSPPMSRKTSAATIALQREPARSPAIVVSRYITPLAADTAARANARGRPTDLASQQADLYRELIAAEDKENRPSKADVPRSESAVTTTSTSTFVTLKSWDPRPVKADVPRADTAGTMKSYTSTTTTTTINRAQSPGGRVRTSSGNYFPYVPPTQQQDDSMATTTAETRVARTPKYTASSPIEISRAKAFARINEAASSMPSLHTTTTSPSNKQRNDRARLPGQKASTSVTSLNTYHTPNPGATGPSISSLSLGTQQSNISTEKIVDRYSGGLQYGWDRDVGFLGSAGTRESFSSISATVGGFEEGGKRKSVGNGQMWGLDLSDVPVFLQRKV